MKATITYAITAGNDDGVFAINPANGLITVLDNSTLDFETTPMYSLTVTATDHSNTSAGVSTTINITNVNDVPTVDNAMFSAAEDTAANEIIGTLVFDYFVRRGVLGRREHRVVHRGNVVEHRRADARRRAQLSVAVTVRLRRRGFEIERRVVEHR